MKHVVIIEQGVNPKDWERVDVPDFGVYLMERFPKFPDNGRIYHRSICVGNDVTPSDCNVEADTEHLQSLSGPFFVVIYPGIPAVAVPWLIGGALLIAGLAMAPSIPEPPNVLARNQQSNSPNNELSDRANRARINGRIPDIFGEVRSTPDLIAAPYKIFENNREVEYSYMCIGRGSYEIDDVRDGDTKLINIPGSTIQVYGPYTSPNRNDEPELIIGTRIQEPIYTARRSNSVNGQVLRPANVQSFTGVGNIRFATPNQIQLFPGNVEDFTKYFVEGDELTISGATMSAGIAVTESVTCYATMTNKDKVFSAGRVAYTFEYGFEPGSLVFEIRDETTVNGLFTVGAEIELTQTFGPLDLSGVYEVESIAIADPKTATAQGDGGTWNDMQRATAVRNNAPAYMVVKLDNPQTVNSNWSSLYAGENFNSMQLFKFNVGHEASQSFDIDLDGVYTVVTVTKEVITLDDPASINSDWSILNTQIATPYLSPTLSAAGEKWVGPFIMTDSEAISLYCNFVASNGLYKDDGTTQSAVSVEIQVEVWPVDLEDEQIDDSEIFNLTLLGSNTLKETLAQTMRASFSSFYGRCAVRARRVTESDLEFEGQVVDEVRWRDVYSIAAVGSQIDFGNVTTIQSLTFATASALAVKERRLNLIARRKIPTWNGSSLDIETLEYSNRIPLVLAAICRDKYLGNRTLEELDIEQWFSLAEEIETYFGTSVVTQFSYTFDNDNVSFEEMVKTVCQAMFCEPYRRGSVIKLSFEKETEDSVLLFNHRNKIPNTEKRSVTFGGFAGDNDGIEYVYVDPADDSINTIFLPIGHAAINPKKVESVGVRDHLQAYFHAWRIWNRIQYQNTTIEFEATQEADLLLKNDRILSSDGTRPHNKQEGEIEEIDGTEITLSQAVDLTEHPSYSIYLQNHDGVVEIIGITAGSAPNKVVLTDAPSFDLSVDVKNSARTAFIIVGSDDTIQRAFLVSEKTSGDRSMTANVKAINYDARYYANDADFINEIIDENGYGQTGGFTPGEGYGYPEDDGPELLCESFTITAGSNFVEEISAQGYATSDVPETSGFGSINDTIYFGIYIVQAAYAETGTNTFVVILSGTDTPPADALLQITFEDDVGSYELDLYSSSTDVMPEGWRLYQFTYPNAEGNFTPSEEYAINLCGNAEYVPTILAANFTAGTGGEPTATGYSNYPFSYGTLNVSSFSEPSLAFVFCTDTNLDLSFLGASAPPEYDVFRKVIIRNAAGVLLFEANFNLGTFVGTVGNRSYYSFSVGETPLFSNGVTYNLQIVV